MMTESFLNEHRELFEAVASIQSAEECALFFDDLLTYNEIASLTQRVRAAKLLLEGKTYDQIIAETKISSATLSRVSKCVRYGEGYCRVLERK